MTYVVVINISAQNFLDNFACANIHWTRSMIVRFTLSTSPLNSVIFRTVYSSRIPFNRQYCLNCPWYSPPLSARIAFSFRFVSLSTFMWNSLKTDSTWSFVFSGETHNFWLWSSINVMKYYDPACHFVSTWHTSVCTSSSDTFPLIGGLTQKEVWFYLPAMQSVHFSSCTFLTSGMRLSSASFRIPFWLI